MIKRIIEFSVRNKFLIIALTIVAMLGGYYSLKNIPVDAIPDLSDTQVIIYSKWDRSPEIIENQVTYPIVAGLLGAPKVKAVRGLTDYGFSYVYVIFEDGTDLYWARSRVLEFLNRVTPTLPNGVKTELGPDATSVGWIFQYALVDNSHKLNNAELRSLQDWNIKFHLQGVSGVAEVASVGGFEKQLQVQVDPQKLQNFHLSFQEVMKAVKESNQETGARVLEVSGAEYMIRSRGLVSNLDEIKNTVVFRDIKNSAVIKVKDLAVVTWGPEERRGITDLDGTGDSVGAVVVMRQGEDTPRVIERVKAKLEELKPSLPSGVEIKTVYDRSDLIERALDTLKHNLVEEMIIVSAVILIFLWHIPSAIVPIITIPISVLLAFIPLFLTGQSSNIMSLAGIAISIGVLVDGAIVEVENAYRKIQHWDENGRKEDFHKVRLEALLEVGPSVFFSLLVIAIAFLPVFTLVDQEGRLFKPLAFSKNFTMAIAAILSVTLDPAIRMLFSKADGFNYSKAWVNNILNSVFVGKYHSEHNHPISKRLFKIYEPAARWVLHKRKLTLGIALALTLSIIPGYYFLGSEFMPTLHEGSLLYMPTSLPGMSVSEAQRVLTLQGQMIKSFPEVESVFGKAGRASTSTDTAPISMVETTIQLKSKDQWRKKPFLHFFKTTISEEELIDLMNEKLRFPGMPNIWTMPIKNRIDMLSTGIRSAVGIKVFGPDLNVIESIGKKAENIVLPISGARTVVAERVAGGFFLDVDFDREALGNFGLSLAEAQDQLMQAVGGETVSYTLNGRERYPIQIRLERGYRQNANDIEHLILKNASEQSITLNQLARVRFTEGPSMIRNENAMPVGYVFVDVDQTKTDIGSFVKKMKAAIAKDLKLPAGYSISFSGQYENMQRVEERLKLVIPLTLFIIVLLLHFNTKSWIKTSIVLLAVPFSLIGAVWFMLILGYHSSIATWVGMIALMGLDAETGVFMLMYLDLSHEEWEKKGKLQNNENLIESIIEGAVHRVRPKMMTVAALFLGLVPIMWSTGAGADVMKRIAAPMIGGLFTSFLLELLIYPVIYFEWKKFKK
jgi:Cu(I)/Ag(I) efflux system membrane protein CusA/SilA